MERGTGRRAAAQAARVQIYLLQQHQEPQKPRKKGRWALLGGIISNGGGVGGGGEAEEPGEALDAMAAEGVGELVKS